MSALPALCAIQFTNINIIVFGILVGLKFEMPEISSMEIYGLSIGVLLFVLNIIRYRKPSPKLLEIKEQINNSKTSGGWAMVYLFISIILFFASAVFAHSHLNIVN